MTTLRWSSVLLLGIAVVTAAAWWLQRQEAEMLRGEIALLGVAKGRKTEFRVRTIWMRQSVMAPDRAAQTTGTQRLWATQ